MAGSIFAIEKQTMKKHISVNTKNSIYIVDPDDILYCKCNNSTTIIYLKDAGSVAISKGISAVEKLLEGVNSKIKLNSINHEKSKAADYCFSGFCRTCKCPET
jgi:archaellum component FlaG (FlaF/FlaG flagellin family)